MDLTNVVVHCPTEELAKAVLKKASKINSDWNEAKIELGMALWRTDGVESCFGINKTLCDNIDYCIKKGYKTISAEEFLKEPKITRVEVITDNGREYVNWHKDNNVEVLMQDDGRTMKIVIKRGL